MASPHGSEPKVYQAGRDVVSAADLNARGQEQKRLGRMTITAPGRIDSTAAGVHIALPVISVPKWFRITGVGTGDNALAHSTVEVVPIGLNVFADFPEGIEGNATVTPLVDPLYSIPPGGTFTTGDVVLAWKGIRRAESGQMVQEWHAVKGGGSGTTAQLVKVNSATDDANGYHDGTLVTDFSGTGHSYTLSGSIWVRNANRIDANSKKLSVRYYLAWKKGTYSSRDVYHCVLGAECINGQFVA